MMGKSPTGMILPGHNRSKKYSAPRTRSIDLVQLKSGSAKSICDGMFHSEVSKPTAGSSSAILGTTRHSSLADQLVAQAKTFTSATTVAVL